MKVLAVNAGSSSIKLELVDTSRPLGVASTTRFVRLVGPARAKELLLLPRTIPAKECLELGLVTSVVGAAELEAAVEELATRLASGPTLAYGSIRNAVAFSSGHSLTESLAREAEYMTLTGDSADHRAAVDAFLAKEKPVFTGS